MSNRPGYAIQEYHDTQKVMEQLNALIKMPIRGIKKEAMEKYLDYSEFNIIWLLIIRFRW